MPTWTGRWSFPMRSVGPTSPRLSHRKRQRQSLRPSRRLS
jgi:hypothetical protein